ncbi:MAG: thioredoxin [Cytophagales bacterium]|jgi:thioredoxin 1|nr:thioredoxin [Cytophagales bacterium]
MENVKVIHVTQDDFEEEVLKSDKPVLVDFFASWCGHCQRLMKIVEQVSAARSDIKVVKVDVDESEMLATQFAVRSVPTIIVLINGKEIKRVVGFVTRDQILQFFN